MESQQPRLVRKPTEKTQAGRENPHEPEKTPTKALEMGKKFFFGEQPAKLDD